MTDPGSTKFDAATFLANAGLGRRIVHFKAKEPLFRQGSAADCVYYIRSGRAKLTVVSKRGKEATVTLLDAGDFLGEEALTGDRAHRATTATALTQCTALRISRAEMLRVMEEATFAEVFTAFMLKRGIRTQADLVDQLFNSSEQRLARILLLMGDFDGQPVPGGRIPPITQGMLAEMIGTTRSRVSFFMNRFRKLGYINYEGHSSDNLRINKQLLNVVLHDDLPEQNAKHPVIPDPVPDKILDRNRTTLLGTIHRAS